jgi:uncharacterized protein (TIGR03067 family)
MKWFIAVAALMAGAAAAADEKEELAKLTGTWKVVSFTAAGTVAEKAEVDALRLVVAGEKYTFTGTNLDVAGTHKLDPSKTPKRIDAERTKGPDAGQKMLGIYEPKDDTFTVCFAAPGKADRPTEFKSTPGSGRRLFVLKREKP